MADDTVQGGTASVEIEAVITLDQGSVDAAKAKLAQELGGADVSTPEGRRGGRGRVGGSTSAATQVNAEAKVKTKLQGTISKDIQSAIDKDEYQLTIDTLSIRKQIEQALRNPFDIVVNAKIQGLDQAVGEHHAAGPTAAIASRATPPEDVLKALTPLLRQNIDSLYRNISQAFTAANRGRFGKQSLEPGNEIEKATEIIGQFGDKFSDMLQVKGPTNKAVGGSLSPKELGAMLGLDPKHPALAGMTTAALGLTSTTKEAGLNSRTADVFFSRLKKWTTSAGAEPIAAAATPAPATAYAASAAPTEAAKQASMAAREMAEEASKEIRAERQRSLTFDRMTKTSALAEIRPYVGRTPNRAFLGPDVPGLRFPDQTTGEDLEADERARKELGGDRANVRRYRKRVPPQHVGGLPLNIEPFLRLAEMGRFQDVFEQFGGKGFNESQGFGQLRASDAGGFSELQVLKAKPGIKRQVAGQEGKFVALRPSEAFARRVLQDTGADSDNATMEVVRSFLASPAVADSIKKALGQGASPKTAAIGGTKRGQGGVKIGTGPSDLGGQAKRLFEFVDYIDGQIAQTSAQLEDVSRSIDALQGSGRPTTGLDKRAAQLIWRGRDLQKKRASAVEEQAEISGVGGGQGTEIMREAARARGERELGQSDVQARGVGLTAAEQAMADTGIFGPVKTGQRQAEMAAAGELPSQQAIVNALVDRYFGNQSRGEPQYEEKSDAKGRRTRVLDENGNPIPIPGTATSQTGYQTLKQAAFGPTGKPRNPKEGQETGLYGELVGGLPAELGPTAKREAKSYIQSTLSSVISDQGFKRGIAEEDIKRKEPMTRPMLGDKTGEGLYTKTPPGILGALRAKIALEEKFPAGHGSSAHGPNTDTHEELEDEGPDKPGLRSRLHELEQRDIRLAATEDAKTRARQKTLGKAVRITGDESRDVARDSGVFMEEEVRHAPFERFNEEHNQQGPGYTRIAASIGAARVAGAAAGGFRGGGGQGGGGIEAGPPNFGEVSGPIHVIVDNTPLLVAFEGAAPGGGRAPRGRVAKDEQPEQPADATPKAPRELRRKNLRDRGVGTEVSPGTIYTYEPDQEGEAAELRKGVQLRNQLAGRAKPTSAAEKHFLDTFQRVQTPPREPRITAASADRRTIEQVEAAKTERILSPTDPAVIQARVTANVAQQRLQSRSLGTSFVSLAESLVPGRKAALARVGELRDAGGRQNQLLNQRENLEQRLGEANFGRVGTANAITERRRSGLADDPELVAKHKIYRESVIGLTAATKENAKALGTVTGEMDALAKGAVGASDVLSNLSAGFIGGVGGGLVVGAVSQASQLIIKGLQGTFGPIVERLAGNPSAVGLTQAATAQGFRANNDRLNVTLAQQGTQARLSDSQLAAISGPLGARGQAVAGTQSLAQQFDLFNTANAARDQQQNGFDRSLTRSTGGAFDVHIPTYLPVSDLSVGGQASTAETLAGQLRNLTGPSDLRQTNPEIGDNLGIGDNFATRQANDQKVNAALLDKNNKQLDLLNANLKDSKFKLAAGGDEQALKDQQARFAAVGAESLGQVLKDKKITVAGLDNATDPREFLKAFNEGPKLSAQQQLTQDQPALQAQRLTEDLQRETQLKTINPQSFAIENAANPLQPAAAGINTTGLTAKEQKNVNMELAKTQKLYDGINTDVQQGIIDAKDFVRSTLTLGDAGSEFAKDLDHVAAIGKEISGIQIGVETKQAAYSAAQFSFQIDLAKRSLSDAKGLVSGVGNGLGAIERQMFNLQRESQQLGFGMSQRQINFQTAVAGFQSPGLTSEEREARKEEAKQEAAYAQKQLNIQEKLFRLSGRQFSITASRGVRDIVRQLGLLEQGREVSISTAVAEKRIAALSKIQAKENKQVETYYQAAVTRTGDIQAEIVKLVVTTQTAMAKAGAIVLKEFASTYQSFIDTINGNPTNSAPRDQPGAPPPGGHAQGFLGSVSGATSLGKYGVAGEAAGEAVAILKDPQKIMAGPGGGGGNTIVVNIYNPVVKSDDDKRKLISDVKRAIQQDARLLLPGRA